jgi:mono/diheme cytochrome c family protein
VKEWIAAVAVLLCAVSIGDGQQKVSSALPAKLARGRYLVEDVGLCGDCHTPHNEKGEPVKEQTLKGAPLDFKPTVPVPRWADRASNIAGLPGWDKEAAIRFMMTGIAYNGLPSRPPMPQFRFHRADAEAIVDFLKSLGGGK